MKKLLLSLMFVLMAVGAKAQFEKNTCYFSTSFSGLNLSYSNNEKFTFGMDLNGGIFVEDAWMLYGKLGYAHTRYEDNVSLGVGGRYYIKQNGLYLGLGLQYEHVLKNVNNLQLCPEIGYAFCLNEFITLEPALYYNMSLNNFADGSKVGLKLGLGFYF